LLYRKVFLVQIHEKPTFFEKLGIILGAEHSIYK